MSVPRTAYDDVVVAAPTTLPYVRYSIRGAHWFLAGALAELIKRAGLAKHQIDGLCVSSFTMSPDTAVGLTQHLGLTLRWLDHIPMGGACGIVALRRAARAVQCGDADIVACIAGDTNHTDTFRLNLATFSQFARDAVYPYGSGGANASFAFLTSYYMRTYGAKPEDFGKLCVAQRANALTFPHALMKKPLTLEEYLTARLIADPLRLFDCVMPCAGADAFLVLRRAQAEGARPALRAYSCDDRAAQRISRRSDPVSRRMGARLRRALWRRPASSPTDIDVLATYDDYPVISFMQIEDLGFCKKGEAPDFVRQHSFSADGSFPINTSGGQLSAGQAGAAGGYLGLVETVRQLTGQALGAAVPDARIGLASGFGMINYDRGLCSGAAILAADG